MASSSSPTPPARWHRVAESALLFALLLGLWVVLSGSVTPLALLLGGVSAGLVTALNPDRLLWIGGGERRFGTPLTSLSLLRLAVYPFRLLVAIVRANVQVAALVLHPRLPIHPALLQFRTGMQRPLSQAALANIITVTPGTVTVDLQNGRYLVHALEPRLAGDLLSGKLQRTVARLLGEAPRDEPRDVRWAYSVQEVLP